MITYRTPESVMKRLDAMQKKLKENEHISIDHGVAVYKFDHYEYEEPTFKNNFESCLIIYVEDFWTHKIIEYMRLNESNLRKPNKDDWFVELVHCSWEKAFPTILNMREYTVR